MALSVIGPLLNGGKRVGGGAGAAPAATDQGQLDRVAPGGMDPWDGHSRQRGSRDDLAGMGEKFSS